MATSGSGQASGMDDAKPEAHSASKPPRLEEARRIIEEHAADLREIIKKLRQKMH